MDFWPKGLNISAKRAIGRPMIPKLQKLGFSTPRALAWLKSHDASYRKTDFLSDWRRYLGIERKKEAIRNVRKDRIPTENVMVPTTDNLSAPFKATYKIYGTDKVTGEQSYWYRSAVSDDPLSMSRWQEQGEIIAYAETYKDLFDLDKVEIDIIEYEVYH